MLKYVYKNHMSGELYASEKKLTNSQRYCESCNESDEFVEVIGNRTDAWIALEDLIDHDGTGGYDFDCIKKFIEETWDS